MLRDVEHEAGLSHGRPRGDEDEVRPLEPRGHLVEIGEPRRHARDQPLVLLELLDRGEAALHEVAQRHEPLADPVLRDLEDGFLRLVQDQVRVLLRLVRRRQDLVGGVNQVPEGGLLLDDARVVLDVGGARHAVGERRDVGGPADFVQLARPRQFVLQRDQIDRVAALAEYDHLLEDAAVRVAEEIPRVDQLRGVIERLVVDQDRAEHGLLRVERMRQRTVGDSDVGHEESVGS